jgi:hypothetical protein
MAPRASSDPPRGPHRRRVLQTSVARERGARNGWVLPFDFSGPSNGPVSRHSFDLTRYNVPAIPRTRSTSIPASATRRANSMNPGVALPAIFWAMTSTSADRTGSLRTGTRSPWRRALPAAIARPRPVFGPVLRKPVGVELPRAGHPTSHCVIRFGATSSNSASTIASLASRNAFLKRSPY